MGPVDWIVIRNSAAAGLLIIVPAALLSLALSDGWPFLFLLVVLVGFVLSGFGAGFMRSDTPMKHGALAAIACYVVVQIFGTLRRVAAGDAVNPLTYPLMALLAGSLGLLGGLFGDWHRRRNHPDA